MQAQRMTLRRAAYVQLEPLAWKKHGLSPTNRVLIFLILVAVATTVIETEPTLSRGHEHLFRWFELIFGSAFLIEYIGRLWVAVELPNLQNHRFPRIKYACSPAAIIDLLAILPTLLAAAAGGALVLRFFRILRILRLAKLGRLSQAWRDIIEAVHSRRTELLLTLALAIIAMLIASTLLYWAEADAQPDKFGSIPRALWWAVVTLTTVGYGDVSPITPLGKLFSGVLAICGIGLIALPTGILAASFSDAMQRRREREDHESETAAR